MAQDAKNTLYYGDNLPVLREHVPNEAADLIYLDPPFNSQADYNVLFTEHAEKSPAQIVAFEDTWTWDTEAARNFDDAVKNGGDHVAKCLQAFQTLLGTSDMLAYLAMMAPRLVELKRVLKPTGSIYLHCDPTASHYLKLLMDAVFRPENFRNEIVWKRTTSHSDSKRWSAVNDVILFYSKSAAFTWNPQHTPHSEEYLAGKYGHTDPDGRRYCLDNMTSPHPRPNMTYEWQGHAPPPAGWRYSRETMAKLDAEGRIWYPDSKKKRPRLKRYLDEMPGVLLSTNWTDIFPINSQAQERLGFPTQKPIALLERIINASSKKGDLVLDPFCGCGTAIEAAQKLKRRWIGIDITHLAINLIKVRLADAFGAKAAKHYTVIGEPTDLAGAKALAAQQKYQFQYWALGLVGAKPMASEQKKGADAGIDGKLYLTDSSGKVDPVIISVKGGHVTVAHVRDLRGVLDREKAAIGVFITLEEPTAPMKAEAASAGFFHARNLGDTKHPRLQVLTIAELLAGQHIDLPIQQVGRSFKQAPKVKQEQAAHPTLAFAQADEADEPSTPAEAVEMDAVEDLPPDPKAKAPHKLPRIPKGK